MDELKKALRAYSDSDEHRADCAAWNEGQWCCLDPDHPEFAKLAAVLGAALGNDRAP